MPLTKKLPVELTDAEVAEKGKQLSEVHYDLDQRKEQKQRGASYHAEAIKKLAADAVLLRDQIRLGKEDREIEIDQVPDYVAGVWVTKRLDTGAEVEREAMTDADLQQHLFTDRELDRAGIKDPAIEEPPAGGDEKPGPGITDADEPKDTGEEASL